MQDSFEATDCFLSGSTKLLWAVSEGRADLRNMLNLFAIYRNFSFLWFLQQQRFDNVYFL